MEKPKLFIAWSSDTAVRPPPHPPAVPSEKANSSSQILQTVKREVIEHQEILKNIVISGTIPSEETPDTTVVEEFMNEIGIKIDGNFKSKRIGKKNDKEMQMLLVTLKDGEIRDHILSRARNLRDKEKFSNVYIQSDKTKTEREEEYRLGCELRKARAAEPRTSFYIRNGEIVRRPIGSTN